jgi:hypothetical protein
MIVGKKKHVASATLRPRMRDREMVEATRRMCEALLYEDMQAVLKRATAKMHASFI